MCTFGITGPLILIGYPNWVNRFTEIALLADCQAYGYFKVQSRSQMFLSFGILSEKAMQSRTLLRHRKPRRSHINCQSAAKSKWESRDQPKY